MLVTNIFIVKTMAVKQIVTFFCQLSKLRLDNLPIVNIEQQQK